MGSRRGPLAAEGQGLLLSWEAIPLTPKLCELRTAENEIKGTSGHAALSHGIPREPAAQRAAMKLCDLKSKHSS